MDNYIIAFQSSRYNGLSLLDELEFTVKSGLKCFDLFFDGFLPSDLTEKEIERVFKLKKEEFFFTLHFPIRHYKEVDSDLEELISFTNKLLPLTVTIHFDKITESVIDYIFGKIDKRVKISFENMTVDINKYSNLDYLNFTKMVKKRYNTYSTFDIGHSFINNKDTTSYLKKILNIVEISTIHIHNNDGIEDSHLSLDKGIIDYTKIVNFIKEQKLDPVFVIEHWDNNLKSYEILKKLLGTTI